MNSQTIRQKFLDFFTSKKHQIVPSAPLVLKNDPTLMFTNAGMNQFKDYFLGNKTPLSTRIADTQKCLRVTGKHNDLEDVGHDTYHHTMFEMLGNWSFGDYFKEEAIAWAWELLTEVYKLPKERLYVTVFEGDDKENLSFDQEAYDIWTKYVNPDHILKGNKKDNFWEMGDQGPCGPCSEIHIDLRPQSEIDKTPGATRVNQDDPQVIEIWNNVFIQYNRKADGSLEPLPAKHVDTGMGFERLVRVIQGKSSNYDTDIFQPLIQQLEVQANHRYTQGDISKNPSDAIAHKKDIAMRVIADHIRAVAFAIADGQLPSNAKAGYVIRRILRRAVRYGYTFLGFKEPFMYKLVPVLAEVLDIFEELKLQQKFIADVIKEEENSFLRTLENGIKLLENEIQIVKSKNLSSISGKTAFELYDTYGFPFDLTSLIARENNISVDSQAFEHEMELQKNRSRLDASSEVGDWIQVASDNSKTQFVGYDTLTAEAKIIKYRMVKTKEKQVCQVVFDITPFYAESGGQVGDTGTMTLKTDGKNIEIPVVDTKKENELTVHYINTDLTSFSLQGAAATLKVDAESRMCTRNNHTATHLMQSALRQVLGTHVQQKGSLVNDDLLRFDFSHFAKLESYQIEEVERIVNKKIRENIPLKEMRDVPFKQATDMGATALFGEKYGSEVRVIIFDPKYSIELCGGTHANATGELGFFKIISETSVAAGVRRIEAVTAQKAEQLIQETFKTLNVVSDLLKKPKDPIKALESVLEENSLLLKKIEHFEAQAIKNMAQELKTKVVMHGGIHCIVQKVPLSTPDAVKTLCFELKNQVKNLFCVLASNIEGKPHISVMISDNLVSDHQLNAVQIVRELAKHIEGGGGGQPFYASAGGKNLQGIEKVLDAATSMLSPMS